MPDPAVVTDPALRAAIIATGRPWRIRDTATQVEMLLVPPGTFQMGCIEGSDQFGCTPAEQPVHHVTLPHAFYMSRHELTQAQWMATMGSNPSMFQGQADSASRPVEQVSWNAIQAYLGATGMRLPTEAEWEYACRAGTQTPFHNGSTDDATLGALAWFGSCCGGNSGERTHAVGGKAANALGFHDMLGNVWEWVTDGYGPYPDEPGRRGGSGDARGPRRLVLRRLGQRARVLPTGPRAPQLRAERRFPRRTDALTASAATPSSRSASPSFRSPRSAAGRSGRGRRS
jgi:formylglycine-generating enzyme required for sulfatase activity